MKHGRLLEQLSTYGPLALVATLLFGLLIFSFVTTINLVGRTTDLASTTAFLIGQNKTLEDRLQQKTVALSDALYASEQRTSTIETRLGGFEQTVGAISGTLGTLQKLSKTDPELLKKYSKVYFLNEHYVPESLVEIPRTYVYSDSRPEQILSQVWPHLAALLAMASTTGTHLYIKSAHRSFYEQATLKTAYSITYGTGTANAFSADQGYSEHQLGTTVDFITTGLNGDLTGFEKTSAYLWLVSNAYRYGFILSYPRDNTYYIFEPWHWRYVGVALATYLHDNNLNFYNAEQRKIDEHLVNIFD